MAEPGLKTRCRRLRRHRYIWIKLGAWSYRQLSTPADIPAHHAASLRLLRRAPGDRPSLRQHGRQAGAALLRRHRTAQVSVLAPQPRAGPRRANSEVLLGVDAGPVGGVHLQRPQSRWDHHGGPRDLRGDADLLPVPAQRLPGRVQPDRGRRSDCGTDLRGDVRALPAIPFDRAFHGAAFRSPGDRPAHPHPRARGHRAGHLAFGPAR